jgi:hypothetical protein
MNEFCKYSMNNTGAGCSPLIKAALMYIAVPTFDSTRKRNYIDAADVPFDEQYFLDKVNDPDISKRWYPLVSLKNPSDKRGESVTQQFDDNTFAMIEQGGRQIMAMIIGKDASPQYYKQLLTFKNVDFSIYVITTDKNLVGMKLDDNDFLYPIRIDRESWDPIWNPGSAKELQAIAIKANYHKSMLDENIQVLTLGEMDYDPSLIEGLRSVDATYSSPDANPGGFVAALTTEYGSFLTKEPVVGLVAADFSLYNVTGGAPIVITSVTEATDTDGNGTGVYTFVIPNQTANDVVRLTPSKQGFDFKRVEKNTLVLP